MHACTIVARNYLAHAGVLADSFCAAHPAARFTVLVLDASAGEAVGQGYDVLDPFSIGIAPAEVHRMAAIYDVTEFATAVKPWLLRTLLDEGDSVIYLDPDIDVLQPLDDVFADACEHGIVLTPHTLEPIPRDGAEPSETTILRAGVYNLGFIGVGRGAEPFLDWWSERLARDCIVDPANGRFVDQRWVDFVPALFRHKILRDPGLNVAWWNLSNRRVEPSGAGWIVGGVPLRFFHFSGFSPETPDLLSKYLLPVPRIHLPHEPSLAALAAAYRARLLARDYHRWSRMAYGWDTTMAGQALGPLLRSAYRRALIHAEETGGAPPPNPFDPAEAAAFVSFSASLPPEAIAPPLERVACLLSLGPGGLFLGRSGATTTFARRAMRRLLWPFLVRELRIHEAYVELFAEQERRLAGLEADTATFSPPECND